jgi:hypothetical protein
MGVRVDRRAQLSPPRSGDRRTAVAGPAAHLSYSATGGAVIVHRLPHTAGMRNGTRHRHRHRDKPARKQQHKQQSGGQAIHNWIGRSGLNTSSGPFATSIGDEKAARKWPQVTVASVIPSADSSRSRGASKSRDPYFAHGLLSLKGPFDCARHRKHGPHLGKTTRR